MSIAKGQFKCDYCGFEGYCYGIGTFEGVSAPFCAKCGRNDKLTKLEEKNDNKDICSNFTK